MDIEGRITFVNPAGLKMLGWEQGELIGRYSHTTIHHHYADGNPYPVDMCPICRTLREGDHPLLSKGAYLLRTNCTETDPAKLWRWYIQLTQAEAAFRTAKSDLGLRPVYHQKTERVEAHLLVCFLSLAMWRSLEMWMQNKQLGTSARKLIRAIATIRSMDVTVPVKRGERVVELHLRTVAKPDKDVAQLLVRLGLHLPKGSKIVQNVVEKTGV